MLADLAEEQSASATLLLRLPAHWRFDQHEAGYRASKAVKRFGIRLLPELAEHLNPMMRRESLELEEALADAFRAAGVPWVEGGH